MLKEIGSNFWLDIRTIKREIDEEINMSDYGIVGKASVFLSTGRAALAYAIDDIKSKKGNVPIKALIPPYTCHTVIQPFLDRDINVQTYNIDSKLYIDPNEFGELVDSFDPDIVLIHRYFGFDTAIGIEEIINKGRCAGRIFIEDRTQNIFSSFNSLPVDYIIGSFRKWGPIPEGGYCVNTKGGFTIDKPEIEHKELVENKMYSFQLKNDYMKKDEGEKCFFLKKYLEAEELLDSEKDYYCMSKVSKAIIKHGNLEELKQKRQENYNHVYKNLNNGYVAILTPELSDNDVPLYLAITSDKRDELQVCLRDKDIYAPIVWPKPKRFPAISNGVEEIYKTVLCFPIDQRYGLDDMSRMVNTINSFK